MRKPLAIALLIIGGAALRIVLSAVTLQNKERTTTK